MTLAEAPPAKKERARPARRNSRNSVAEPGTKRGKDTEQTAITAGPLPRLRGKAKEAAKRQTQNVSPGPLPDPPLAAISRQQRDGEQVRQTLRPDPEALLAWFDRHRRDLPWRARPGEPADPYRVWLSEIMLQQTTVKTVAPFFARFLARFPSVADLAKADAEDVLALWAGLGYYARARNLHACARAVAARGGFPHSEPDLLTLPGIGAYTAAAIAAIAFDRPAVPVDGNVERVVARLFAVEQELPNARRTIRSLAAGFAPAQRPGDFAQAMMDLGATICTPKAPVCALCPFSGACAARRRGDPETFPRKRKKAEGQMRRGAAFVAVRADGCVLVRRRAAKGLLGGMTEVPTTAWSPGFDAARAIDEAPGFAAQSGGTKKTPWRRIPGVVAHAFTHFPLELTVFRADLPLSAAAADGTRWLSPDEITNAALPTVMRKVLVHALARGRPHVRPAA